MSKKEYLHILIDRLPEDKAEKVTEFIEKLIADADVCVDEFNDEDIQD